jgi:urease subunit alpha
MYSSDSQAMGRIGESFAKLYQTADKMKRLGAPLVEQAAANDNARILRYLAKLTINPARTHGIAHEVGSLEPGKLADIVLWPIQFFGAKPKMIVKGGLIAWSVMGDPNASIPTTEPVLYRPMWGAFGRATAATSVTFTSRAAAELDIGTTLGLRKRLVPVAGCRSVGKRDMVRNDRTPRIEVDPETYVVKVDGEIATVPPAERLSHTQLFYLV